MSSCGSDKIESCEAMNEDMAGTRQCPECVCPGCGYEKLMNRATPAMNRCARFATVGS